MDRHVARYPTKEEGLRAVADACRVSYRLVLKWYYEAVVPNPRHWRRLADTIRVSFDELVADSERVERDRAA